MSQTTTARFLLEDRGVFRNLEAFVVAARFSRDSASVAFALGDGTLRIVRLADTSAWHAVPVHDGAVLALATDTEPAGFVSGGDDGAFRRIASDAGTNGAGVTDIARFGMKWVEQVASFADPKGKGKGDGLLACAVGKVVHLFDAAGQKLKEFVYPSAVTGLAFDAKGKRVGASHYNGATLRFVAAKTDTPRVLEWKGSHTGLAINPDGDSVVTAMQENALHGWRLSDGQHMRMSGYPSKSASLSFTRNGRWLASSGADAMVLWPFFGGGPMGKAPMELAGGDGILCTQVACHPQQEMVAGGFADGLVVVADIGSSRVLPMAPPEHGPVSALAWSPDGARLAFGTEKGFAAILDLSAR
ncbi:MAG TPA: WD40 repeat domain-containing protein [Acetobacteraceae bacterium]|nr:WD40 repeat domain-containing protein [Acetobacteraceae bacterium]